MIKLQIHTVKDTVTACLLFVAVCAPLGVVRIITPELPAEETIGQWVWFGKALLLSSICILIASLLQLTGKDTRKHVLRFSYFSVCVSWGFMLCGALEAIGGLRQLYGFAASSIRDRMRGIWQWYCLFVCICIYVFLKIKQLFIIWKRG